MVVSASDKSGSSARTWYAGDASEDAARTAKATPMAANRRVVDFILGWKAKAGSFLINLIRPNLHGQAYFCK